MGIAKLFAEVCEVSGSDGSGAYFCGVVEPTAECIVASVAIKTSEPVGGISTGPLFSPVCESVDATLRSRFLGQGWLCCTSCV